MLSIMFPHKLSSFQLFSWGVAIDFCLVDFFLWWGKLLKSLSSHDQSAAPARLQPPHLFRGWQGCSDPLIWNFGFSGMLVRITIRKTVFNSFHLGHLGVVKELTQPTKKCSGFAVLRECSTDFGSSSVPNPLPAKHKASGAKVRPQTVAQTPNRS